MKILKLIKKCIYIFNNLVMAIQSLFWRRDKTVVLFGAWFGYRFADTSRFLFQYLSENKQELGLSHVVWVTRSKDICEMLKKMGYECYQLYSKESVRYHKKALYHIVCNAPYSHDNMEEEIMGKYSFGAKRINLWHGVMAMKGVGCASTFYKRKKAQENNFVSKIKDSKLYRIFCAGQGGWEYCYYLSVTKAGTDTLKKFFELPDSRYIETTCPRIKECLKYTPYEQEILQHIQNYKVSILYVPTFRDKDSSFNFYDASLAIRDLLKKENILWIQKPHVAAYVKESEDKDNNILNLDAAFDLNILMPYINILITDFSSVAADAMFYNKQILYYMPDYDEYSNGSRGFVIDPETVMVSDIIKTPMILRERIISAIKNVDYFVPSDKYLKIKENYWGATKSYFEIWNDIKKGVKGE